MRLPVVVLEGAGDDCVPLQSHAKPDLIPALETFAARLVFIGEFAEELSEAAYVRAKQVVPDFATLELPRVAE
jgi:hypothetical protein